MQHQSARFPSFVLLYEHFHSENTCLETTLQLRSFHSESWTPLSLTHTHLSSSSLYILNQYKIAFWLADKGLSSGNVFFYFSGYLSLALSGDSQYVFAQPQNSHPDLTPVGTWLCQNYARYVNLEEWLLGAFFSLMMKYCCQTGPSLSYYILLHLTHACTPTHSLFLFNIITYSKKNRLLSQIFVFIFLIVHI